MALLFHPNMAYLAINRGFGAGISSSLTVFGGAQPSPAEIIQNWATYRTSFLLHHTGAAWTHPINGTTTFLSLTTLPAAATANATGTGEWAVLWSTPVAQGSLSSPTIPSTSFVVVPVSAQVGQGVVRYLSNIFSAGVSYSVLDGTLTVVLA